MNRQVFKDPLKQSEFQKKGYVKMPLLSQSEVQSILNFINTLQPDDNFRPGENQPDNHSSYHCSFLDTSKSYKRQLHDHLSSFFDPHISTILPNFKILSINFHIKQPGYGEMPIHQNWTTAPINDTTVSVWCPLVDVSEKNGGIYLVEGSHKIVPDIASLNSPIFFRPFENDLIKNDLKPVIMSAGEILVFDDSLIHWSPQNKSNKPRIAIQIIMVPTDVTPRYYHYDKKSNTFEALKIDTDFLIQNTAQNLVNRPEGLESLGFSKSKNKELTYAEFKDKLRKGEKTRHKIYFNNTPNTTNKFKKYINFFSTLLKK